MRNIILGGRDADDRLKRLVEFVMIWLQDGTTKFGLIFSDRFKRNIFSNGIRWRMYDKYNLHPLVFNDDRLKFQFYYLQPEIHMVVAEKESEHGFRGSSAYPFIYLDDAIESELYEELKTAVVPMVSKDGVFLSY